MRNMHLGLTWCGLVFLAGCLSPLTSKPVESPRDAAFELQPAVTFTPCMDGLPERGMWKCDPAFADVNDDGFLDLAALPRLGDGPDVWLGDGTGEWAESSAGLNPGAPSCGGGLKFADLNGDGHLDLAVADHCQGVYVYLGNGAGEWEMVTQSLYPRELVPSEPKAPLYVGAEDVAVGDVNGDGFLDLVAGSSDQAGINLYLGDGTGRNWTRVSNGLPTSGWANRVALFDINQDGALDLIASYNEGPRVWLNLPAGRQGDGQGGWQPASTGLPSPTLQGLFTGLAVGDIDEDGLSDLAVANWVDGPEVYLQQADGAWQKTADVFPQMQGGAVGLALGDVDRDGHLDMVVSGRLRNDGGFVRGVFVLCGDGAGGWRYVEHSGLPDTGLAAMSGVTLADVNNDGVLDLAAASGLIVETVPGPTEPVLPARLLLWCTDLPGPVSDRAGLPKSP